MDPFTLNLLLLGLAALLSGWLIVKVSDWLEKKEKTRAREV